MPLEVGRKWTYDVNAGLVSRIEPLAVTRETAVAGVRGYELAGPLGVSRLGWNGDSLLVDSFANARFTPAIPILNSQLKDAHWHGRLESLGVVQPASASLIHKKVSLSFHSRQTPAVLTILSVKLPDRTMELQTWFSEGIGILRQEQRTRRTDLPGAERDIALQLRS